MKPHSNITQPIVHAGEHARDIMDWMIETGHLKDEYSKPDNITFITAHNYVDDELGTAESKLHRHNQLFDLDGRKVSIFEKNLHHLGLGLPIVNKIINEHFGEINIKNKKNGNGTIINILLSKTNE